MLHQPLTRRALCGGLLAAPLAAQPVRGALYAYVGCYTTLQRSARGDGIHVYRIDAQTGVWTHVQRVGDRKSTRLNSSHLGISYAVFCLKKKTNKRSKGGR